MLYEIIFNFKYSLLSMVYNLSTKQIDESYSPLPSLSLLNYGFFNELKQRPPRF